MNCLHQTATCARRTASLWRVLYTTSLAIGLCLCFCWPLPAAEPAESPAKKHVPGPMLTRFLQGPMAHVDEIVFAVRVEYPEHVYVNFGYYCDNPDIHIYGQGTKLSRMNLRTGEVKVLLDDPKGGVRDPQVHYDGQRILFSYRRGGTPTYHLYEINIDGTGLRQLTDGPDDDVEPTYVPDGGIVFCSTRCRRYVNCWNVRVATIYRCDGDGGNIRMLSSNNDTDATPWMLPDGRVLFMRWDYTDRTQFEFKHLWTMNPDGTGQMTFIGNHYNDPSNAYLDAKPIPGTNKVVASVNYGHGSSEHRGITTIFDPSFGPDAPEYWYTLHGGHSRIRLPVSAKVVGKPTGYSDRDPYAMSEDCFLVADERGISVMDGAGERELIYELSPSERRLAPNDRMKVLCNEPRPLVARPREPVIPSRVDLSSPTGRLVLLDVYKGRNMAGVKRGEIKKLLVLQALPKPANLYGTNNTEGMGAFAMIEVLGRVPVEPDGSAYMELPALKSVFFVALDANNNSVKRMQSFVTLQPGEVTGCVGCHEPRTEVPPGYVAPLRELRLRRPEPIAGVPRVIDFPRDIQPVLDKHCVKCHNADRRDGRVSLIGDKTGWYTISWETIRDTGLVAWGGWRIGHGDVPPRGVGSGGSKLMKLLDGSHYDAKLSEQEMSLVSTWIDTAATSAGTYASLGCGMYDCKIPNDLMKDRCGSCHTGHDPATNTKVQVFRGGNCNNLKVCGNLSRPEKSLVLMAPLAKEAGGLGLCKGPVFRDTTDPLYQEMLKHLKAAAANLEKGKRFDMPGFRPNKYYIQELQRFGALPADLKPDDPIDVYAADRAYFDSFDYRPPAGLAAP